MIMQQSQSAFVLLNAVAQTTSTDGAAVDLTGETINIGKRNVKAILSAGARTYTGSPTVTFKIEEDSTSGFTSPTTLTTFTAIATTAATSEVKHFLPTKQYVRYVSTFSAATTTGAYAVILIADQASA